MAYLGNLNGPRESEIFNRLGHLYFGCSAAALETEISDSEFGEAHSVIVPVHVDHGGKPYIELSRPDRHVPERYYLDDAGYLLSGDIETYTKQEKEAWSARLAGSA
jgi:hypothetical protein